MSRKVFKRLSDHAESGGTPIADADKARWIKRLSDEDAELMAKAEITDRRKITRQMRAVQFEHNEDCYFAFFGFPPIDGLPSGLPNGLTEQELTPGTFGIAITETDVIPKATPYNIRDIIETQFKGAAAYQGHELGDVADLFPPVLVVQADRNLAYTSDIDRVLGAMVAGSYTDGPISLSEDTLKTVADLFEAGSEYIPYPNILQGILSISWGGLYLELYRCLEQLYGVPRLIELTKDWPAENSIAELVELLEKHLSWRPKEDESLIKVIGSCSKEAITRLSNAFKTSTFNGAVPADQAGRSVYALRNSLVHFRRGHEPKRRSDEEWDEIVAAMLVVVAESYDSFGKSFHEMPIAQAVPIATEVAKPKDGAGELRAHARMDEPYSSPISNADGADDRQHSCIGRLTQLFLRLGR